MRRVAVLLPLAACGPVPVEQAERSCLEEAALAERPRGEVYAGASSVPRQVGGHVDVSTDFLLGRDPSQVFNACVLRRAGQMPVTPYEQQPDYRG